MSYKAFTQNQFIKSVNRLVPEKPIPGEKYLPTLTSYSNSSIGLLGQVLMHMATLKTKIAYPFTATGFSQWIKHYLTKDLKMPNTSVYPKGVYSGYYAYNDQSKSIDHEKPYPWYSSKGTAGGLRSNTLDMVKFIHTNLCAYSLKAGDCSQYPNKLLVAMAKAQQVSHYTPSGSLKDSVINVLVNYKPYFMKAERALAWLVSPPSTKDPSFAHDDTVIWKSGGHPGSSSWIGLSPTKRYGVIILANTHIGDELKLAGLRILGQVKSQNKG